MYGKLYGRLYSKSEDLAYIFDLKTQLWQLKRGKKDVIDNYMKMTPLWQELYVL